MSSYGFAAALLVASYLIGSFPTGLVVARSRGVDIRAVGSGNIGATNVARSLSKALGVLVLALDALKGAVPVIAVFAMDLEHYASPFMVTAAGVAAIVGHCFPPWLRFRGGKGVATSWGVFLAADPAMAGIAAVIFALVYGLFRVASLGSLTAAIALPLVMWLGGRSEPLLALAVAGAIIIVVKHSSNIRRLIRRAEHRV